MAKPKTFISWNVNGLRAVLKKGFAEWLEETGPDVLCLQEIKAEKHQVDFHFNGYHQHGGEKTHMSEQSALTFENSFLSRARYPKGKRRLQAIHDATGDDALRDFTAAAATAKPKDRSKGIRMLARGQVHADALADLPEPLRERLARLRLAERVSWAAYGALAFLWVGALVIQG